MNKATNTSVRFAMDGSPRPIVPLANSDTRASTPPLCPPAQTNVTGSASNGGGVMTLGQLAQIKPGGIK